MSFDFLSVDEVLELHRLQLERYGGAPGLRDLGLLESAVAQPAATFEAEYLHDGPQIARAGLEDVFCGKLAGLPMGCDVCYTNHAHCDQNAQENLAVLLAAAGCAYFMGLPLGDDIMLNYQSTSFHDNAAVRAIFGYRPTPEFEAWMESLGLLRDGTPTARFGDPTVLP